MKIFGNGFIAKNLKKAKLKFKDNYIIYAAGISNSKTLNKNELLREQIQIKKFIKKYKSKIIIYISTMSIFDKFLQDSYYVKNKIFIENFIKKNTKKFIIIRLTQLVGKNNNNNTIINFFYNKIKTQSFFYLWNGFKRNLIDIQDLKKIFKNLVNRKYKKSCSINVYNTKSISVNRIVNIMSGILRKKANFELIYQKKRNYFYKQAKKKYEYAYLFKDKNYNEKVLTKYYK